MSGFDPDKVRAAQKRLQEAINNGALQREQQRRQRADQRQRREAEKEVDYDDAGKKIPRPRFLRPQDIAAGDEYDVERTLYTTLGVEKGQPARRITRDDIKAFQENIELLKDHYKGGITPQNVINLSMQDDIDRANEQIHLAMPQRRVAGLVTFITNSGPDSKVSNHFVNVEFTKFNSVVFDLSKNPEAKVKTKLAYSNIKFECDCERFTFWYRYMATIGGYGLGRLEPGFPKYRNPMLSGVACKHALRVMKYIMSPLGVQYLQKAVEKDRNKQLGETVRQTKRQLNREIDEQLEAALNQSNTTIRANIPRAEQEMLRRAAKVAKEANKKRMREIERAQTANGNRAAEQLARQVEARRQSLGVGLTETELAEMEAFQAALMRRRGSQ